MQKHLVDSRPLLLGYSGGTDSAVLFALLLKAKIPFIAAHVDHGWREGSDAEASALKEFATGKGVPFYSTRLELKDEKGNLEEICREKRYAYFKELSELLDTQAVCLAHHRDDNSETTLIRLLQGYSLSHLAGMTPDRSLHGLRILRPLLDVPKKELLKYPLEISPILDHTNHDPKFLRARLRALPEALGKEIEGPLVRIAQESEELNQFLKSHLAPLLKQIQPICCGWWLDLSPHKLSLFEQRCLLREFLRHAGAIFSHHLIESALEALATQKANHTVQGLQKKLVVDRGHLFLIENSPTFTWEPCKEGPERLGWKALLQEELVVFVPEGGAVIPCVKHFSDRWNKCHVPAFLRSWAPVVKNRDGSLRELLSEKIQKNGWGEGTFYRIVPKPNVDPHQPDVIR